MIQSEKVKLGTGLPVLRVSTPAPLAHGTRGLYFFIYGTLYCAPSEDSGIL